jgi:hypothetical protein
VTAFSNGFEFDCWSSNWCSMCIHDDQGLAPEGTYCAILSDVMVENEVPSEWNPGTDDLRNRYHCTKFEGANHG